jgi:hypothetical protein
MFQDDGADACGHRLGCCIMLPAHFLAVEFTLILPLLLSASTALQGSAP